MVLVEKIKGNIPPTAGSDEEFTTSEDEREKEDDDEELSEEKKRILRKDISKEVVAVADGEKEREAAMPGEESSGEMKKTEVELPPVLTGKQQATAKVNAKSTRINWKRVEKTSTVNGKKVTSNPFLAEAETNHLDFAIIKHLAHERPYLSDHGGVLRAFEDCAKKASTEVHPVTGKPLFTSLDGPKLKARFEALMQFTTKLENGAPKRTGTDDEYGPDGSDAGQLLGALEEMQSELKSFKDEADSKKKASAENKKNDLAASEALRLASLGLTVPKDPDGKEDGSHLRKLGYGSTVTPAFGRRGKSNLSSTSSSSSVASAYTTKKASKKTTTEQIDDNGSVYERLEQRAQARLLHEKNQKRKLELQAERLAAKKKVKEEELRLRAEDQRLRKEELRIQAESAKAENEQKKAMTQMLMRFMEKK